MKNLFLIAVIVLGFSSVSFGQVNATASSSATIITPIAIEKNVDLNFGTLAVNSLPGTVVLPAAAVATRTRTGGVTLPAVTGTVSAAKFTVTGLVGSVYTISMPASIELANGENKMTYTTSFSPATLSTLTTGDNVIYVGGTLAVVGNQVAGTYTNTTGLAVTVNYN